MQAPLMLAFLSTAPFNGCSIREAPLRNVASVAPHSFLTPHDTLVLRIDAEIESYVEKGFSGIVLVEHHNEIILHKNYAGIKERTAYWIQSLSKSFTAAAILKLQQQGQLSVNDPLSRFFDHVPADKMDVTIHHLLTHSSGLPDQYLSDGIIDRSVAAKAILDLPLHTPIGEKYQYCSDGYSLLAMIIEIASRQPFEVYLQNEVLSPLGLSETGFWGFETNTAIAPFAVGTDTSRIDTTIYHVGRTVANWGWRGATGMYSTTTDLHKWMRALAADSLLTRYSREQMWGRQILIAPVSETIEAFYGYGWGLRFRNGHNGAMAFYPNGDAFIVLSNTRDLDGTPWSLIITRSLHERLEALHDIR
jgi:CubicO group peptidase (beta-lactamase class C family)